MRDGPPLLLGVTALGIAINSQGVFMMVAGIASFVAGVMVWR
jgi:hypothetical protein